MQAVAEPTGPGIKLLPELRKKHPQFLGVIWQIWTVEARGVRHPRARPQGKQLHVAGGVAPALQSTGHRSSAQLKIRTQLVQQAALAHPGRSTQHRQLRTSQALP